MIGLASIPMQDALLEDEIRALRGMLDELRKRFPSSIFVYIIEGNNNPCRG